MPQGPVKLWLLGCKCTLEDSRLNPEKPIPSPNPFVQLVAFVSVSCFVSDVPSYSGGRLVQKMQGRPQLAPFPAGVRREDVALPLPLPPFGLAWTRLSTSTCPNCFRASRESQWNESTNCACPALVITCPSRSPPGTSISSWSAAWTSCSVQCSSAAARLRSAVFFSVSLLSH